MEHRDRLRCLIRGRGVNILQYAEEFQQRPSYARERWGHLAAAPSASRTRTGERVELLRKRIELGSIGRRTAETELELLNLIE